MKAPKLVKLAKLLKPKLQNSTFKNLQEHPVFTFGKIWDAFVFLDKWNKANAQFYQSAF